MMAGPAAVNATRWSTGSCTSFECHLAVVSAYLRLRRPLRARLVARERMATISDMIYYRLVHKRGFKCYFAIIFGHP